LAVTINEHGTGSLKDRNYVLCGLNLHLLPAPVLPVIRLLAAAAVAVYPVSTASDYVVFRAAFFHHISLFSLALAYVSGE
jgi:hypothetical protein